MQIYGLHKTTLLDYPGHLASTIFLGGCNFRCPFCHNKGLLAPAAGTPSIPEETVMEHLTKRKGVIEGVCITGGEPTLSEDLPEFIRKIKKLGYLIKLDTNGYRPQVIKALLDEQLPDYIAMDIKTSPDHYEKVCGISCPDLHKLYESVDYIMNSGIAYEFRTTFVRELHSKEDVLAIGAWIKGCSAYYLQSYRENEQVLTPGFSGFSKEELSCFTKLLSEYIPNTALRGID